jgi:hypothetical protein
MVEIGTGTKSTRFVDTKYPNEEGLILGTTKIEGRAELLEPESSNVLNKDREGI